MNITSSLHNADCLDILKAMPDNCVHSVVTDPPYGLSFMGKGWDKDVPAQEIWEQCLRVLKPGGHLIAFSSSRTYHHLAMRVELAGVEVRDQIIWLYGSGVPKSKNHLKPAHEPAVLARKPISEKTIAANVLAHGTGGLNIDACRIEVAKDDPVNNAKYHAKPSVAYGKFKSKEDHEVRNMNPDGGRFPANIIHDGSEAVEDLFPKHAPAGGGRKNEQGKRFYLTDAKNVYSNTKSSGEIFWDEKRQQHYQFTASHPDNGGSASRYFYCAKASPAERGAANNHPTVKPIDLMRYLCKLVTPPNGIVLDPFMGSGTTGIACKKEHFKFIGIERDPEYFDIAQQRIHTTPNTLF